MRGLRAWFWRLNGLFRKERRDQEFAAEMESHLQMHIEDNLRSGMSAQEARRQALLKLGGVEPTKEIYRERRGLPLLETALQDLRYATRTLRKNPGFTIIVVLTLALGIGANTAIFSMVNALLLHPYNFPELDRLVRVWENRGIDEGADARFIAPGDAVDLQSGAPVFDALATYKCGDFNLNAEGNVQPVLGCHVSANFFDVLGVGPALGRAFSAPEEQPGADQVAVVSYGFWQQHFAGDAGLLGKTIQMNEKKYTVIGIMPRGFDYPVPMELWVPLALSPGEKTDRVTFETEITDSIAIIRIMGVLMALFGCVALALSSVGVYGVLAEGVARRIPEIGVRLALGAEPRDVMKLVLGQAVKLAGIGLAIGVPIAFAVNRAMSSLIFGIVSINLLLLAGFTLLLLLVALAAAYIPARRAMRVDPLVALRHE